MNDNFPFSLVGELWIPIFKFRKVQSDPKELQRHMKNGEDYSLPSGIVLSEEEKKILFDAEDILYDLSLKIDRATKVIDVDKGLGNGDI